MKNNTINQKINSWTNEEYDHCDPASYANFVSKFTIEELQYMIDEIDYSPRSSDDYQDYGWCIIDNTAGIIYGYVYKKLKEMIESNTVGEESELANTYLGILELLNP